MNKWLSTILAIGLLYCCSSAKGVEIVPGPEHHYYCRHDTSEYYPDAKEAIDAILRGWVSEDQEYTLQSVYDSAPVF